MDDSQIKIFERWLKPLSVGIYRFSLTRENLIFEESLDILTRDQDIEYLQKFLIRIGFPWGMYSLEMREENLPEEQFSEPVVPQQAEDEFLLDIEEGKSISIKLVELY